MADNQFKNAQSLRKLAGTLQEQHCQFSEEPKRPAPTDQDILRAMLGKPWRTNPADSTQSPPARKAG